jgi:hypothetical protein
VERRAYPDASRGPGAAGSRVRQAWSAKSRPGQLPRKASRAPARPPTQPRGDQCGQSARPPRRRECRRRTRLFGTVRRWPSVSPAGLLPVGLLTLAPSAGGSPSAALPTLAPSAGGPRSAGSPFLAGPASGFQRRPGWTAATARAFARGVAGNTACLAPVLWGERQGLWERFTHVTYCVRGVAQGTGYDAEDRGNVLMCLADRPVRERRDV